MEISRTLVRFILDHAPSYDWTLQGFGMLRLYLDDDKRFRLHVWDSRFAVPGVSVMHNHPWHFMSYVVAGKIENYRYEAHYKGEDFMCQTIKCGEGGGLVGTPSSVTMRVHRHEIYGEDRWYHQEAHEVHISVPKDGTVTLVERMVPSDPDHATVYWPAGQQWVSAEPRLATEQEVRKTCLNALEKWF